jgi:two-component system response regulator TctD
LLRRSQQQCPLTITRIGKLEFDTSAKTLKVGDEVVELPLREFRLLEILIGNLGRVLSKDDISSRLFDFDDEAGANAIEVYVGRLRRRLGGVLTIRTMRGRGYSAEPPQLNG